MSLRGRTSTIRFRTTALAVIVVAAVLVLTSLALVVAQRRLLIESLDESLAQRAEEIVALAAAGQLPDDSIALGDDDARAVVTGPDGSVLWSSPTAREPRESAAGYRVLTREVVTNAGPSHVSVASPLDDIDESTRGLAFSLAIAVPVVVAILGALMWWLVGRTLRPVEAIRTEVATISGSNLDRRVPAPSSGDEIEALAHTMNDMLARIEEATARQRQFVADASHELRSPLTRMRSELEVTLLHPETADAGTTERSVLEDTIQMQRLVDDLLYLARSDAGANELIDLVPVDLDSMVRREAEQLRSDGIRVDTAGVGPARVTGNTRSLRRAIRNVAENAARHAERAVTFELVADPDAHRVVLTIHDDGPGVPAEQRERVFDRFTRVDDARSRRRGGTGLGLAITRDVVKQHGGTIRFDPDAVGARVIITLPAARPSG